MSLGPCVSVAIAICTASLTSAGFIPTSSGFLCCQSRRSGIVGRLRGSLGGVRTAETSAKRRGRLRESGRDDESGEDQRKCASQHGVSPCEGCSIVHESPSCASAFARRSSRCASARRVALAAAQAPADVTLDVLLDRAGWYLDYFVDEFENVVAEERYIQDSSALLPSFSPVTGGRGAVSGRTSPSEILRARHRELRSDFLLVKSPNTEALVPFRDVIDVDGVAVRDREARLARLFLNAPSASPAETIARAEQIREEGARYNLGSMRSTLGNPVLALGVLQKTYQQRFRFTLGKEDRNAGPGVSVVDYQEVSSPAMIRGEGGHDLMAHGRLWIDTVSGRVLRTELQVEQPAVRAVVTTTFRLEERSGIARAAGDARAVHARQRQQHPHGGDLRTFPAVRRHAPVKTSTRRRPTVIEPWTGMTLVELPPGRFTMGSASSEVGRNDDEVLHEVEITRPFLLGQYEVTQQEWRTVMGTSPSQFASCGSRCPVENVTFDEVQQFLAKLNARAAAPGSKAPSLRFRLPTEAEWEYACRAQHHRAVFHGREPHDRSGELQRTISVRAVCRPRRRVPAEAGAGRHVPAEPVGTRRHARQRVGVDRRLVRPVPARRRPRTSTRPARRAARSASFAEEAGCSTPTARAAACATRIRRRIAASASACGSPRRVDST